MTWLVGCDLRETPITLHSALRNNIFFDNNMKTTSAAAAAFYKNLQLLIINWENVGE